MQHPIKLSIGDGKVEDGISNTIILSGICDVSIQYYYFLPHHTVTHPHINMQCAQLGYAAIRDATMYQ